VYREFFSCRIDDIRAFSTNIVGRSHAKKRSVISVISVVLFVMLFLMFLPGMLHAQDGGVIRGKVFDAQTKEPLIGANVFVRETSLRERRRISMDAYVIRGVPAGDVPRAGLGDRLCAADRDRMWSPPQDARRSWISPCNPRPSTSTRWWWRRSYFRENRRCTGERADAVV
jgi:hypothetical protein